MCLDVADARSSLCGLSERLHDLAPAELGVLPRQPFCSFKLAGDVAVVRLNEVAVAHPGEEGAQPETVESVLDGARSLLVAQPLDGNVKRPIVATGAIGTPFPMLEMRPRPEDGRGGQRWLLRGRSAPT